MKRKAQPKSSRSSGGKTLGNSLDETLDDTLDATSNDKRARVVRCIRSLPAGKVSSYGAVAKAAGWPGGARQVVRILRLVSGLPWHRVVGAGGAIKLRGENGAEQKFRLRMEGVTFRGARRSRFLGFLP